MWIEVSDAENQHKQHFRMNASIVSAMLITKQTLTLDCRVGSNHFS